ncbi:MAG: hypothetical protein ACI4A5_03240 [Hominilimicola sp.]
MMEKVVFILVIFICTIRIVGYGIFTVKDKNKTGGIGLFVMALMTASASIYFLIK